MGVTKLGLSAQAEKSDKAAIDVQITVLENIQTPRLIREATLGSAETIRGTGILAGMTPAEALAYIDTQIVELRKQRTSVE